MSNDVAALDSLVEGTGSCYVLDNSVLELILVLREHGDPFCGFATRSDGTLDGVSSFEES